MINNIHTGFYTTAFAYLLKKFYSYMESGKFGQDAIKNAACVSVDRDPNGEVVIHVERGIQMEKLYNNVYEKKESEAEILAWIGWILKSKTHEMLERYGWNKYTQWIPGNFDIVVDFLSDEYREVCVGDVYYIYDALTSDKNIDMNYDIKIVEKWRGIKQDFI